jgi:phosphatidylserine/phosphatidylglycerophosphate/cardiolipin synthase-like enzyme
MKKLMQCFLLFSLVLTPFFLWGKTEVLFSPNDRPTKKLIDLINTAQKKIHAAVYMITDKVIATALIKAKKERGVDVQIITDRVSVDSSYGKGKFLKENGVPVHVYGPIIGSKKNTADQPSNAHKMFNMAPLMHNKFALFDDKLVLTGSFNWTRSANQKNRENMIIMDEKEVLSKYQKEFIMLKEKSGVAVVKKSSDEEKQSNVKEIYLRFFDLIKKTLKLT